MAQKWNLQDIVPPDRARHHSSRPAATPQAAPARREVRRDVERPTVRPRARESATPAVEEHREEEAVPEYDETDSMVARLEVTDGRLSRMRRYIIIAFLVAVVGAIGLGVTILLSGAEVTINPKINETSVQATYDAKLQPKVGELGYELLTLEEEGERQVAATGKEDVATRAEGQITVFNAFSSTPQRLIKNTRFESPNGLIYRISDSIEIPGYKKDASGGIIPGSVKAAVFADGTGENYNIASVRFSVPGLKGGEQYDKVYAEVDAKGLAGGFEGTKFIINEDELATTRQKLQTELRDKLLSRIKTERPNGFIAYNDAITFTYESMPAQEAGDKAALVKERARLHIPLFNEQSFASFIAKSTVSSYGGEPVRIEDHSALVFSYEHADPLADMSTQTAFSFKLAGTVKTIWEYDEAKLKEDLAGKPESTLPDILKNYPAINKAQAVVRPLWKSSFPENPDEIKVIEVVKSE